MKVRKARDTNPKRTEFFTQNVHLINNIITEFRKALSDATTRLGSKINPKKTEVIVPITHAVYISHEAKTEFKWLGYTFKLDRSNLLTPTDNQLTRKIAMTTRMFDDILAYVKDIKVRHKVYKIWAAPVLEFFMLHQAFHTSVYTSDLEKLQHKLLTSICNLPNQQVSRSEIHKALNELPIQQKLTRFAYSLGNFPTVKTLIQSHETAKLHEVLQSITSSRTTRGTSNTEFSEKYTEQLSLPLRLHNLSTHYLSEKDMIESQLKENKVDYTKLKSWINNTKRRIKMINELRSQFPTNVIDKDFITENINQFQ